MQTTDARPTAAQKDNLFGICHAVGEAFGFNPVFLRVALAVLLLFNPEAMLIVYGTAGLAVLASRVATIGMARRAARRQQPRIAAVLPRAYPEIVHERMLESMAA